MYLLVAVYMAKRLSACFISYALVVLFDRNVPTFIIYDEAASHMWLDMLCFFHVLSLHQTFNTSTAVLSENVAWCIWGCTDQFEIHFKLIYQIVFPTFHGPVSEVTEGLLVDQCVLIWMYKELFTPFCILFLMCLSVRCHLDVMLYFIMSKVLTRCLGDIQPRFTFHAPIARLKYAMACGCGMAMALWLNSDRNWHHR